MHALVNAHIITDNTKLMNDIDVNFFSMSDLISWPLIWYNLSCAEQIK